ncbi:MAG TPA: L,D-transpeptidase [Mycobacteriales bacterium]|nr:L,D-transpeptidase [Mycobacteriales bacterium]
MSPAVSQRTFWRRRLAVGTPFVLAVALVLAFTLGVDGSTAKAHARGHRHARAQLASLLLASSQAAAVRTATGPTPSSSETLSPVGQPHRAAAPAHASGSSVRGTRMAPARYTDLVPETTVVAHLSRSVPGYPSANALGRNRTVPGSWYGYPSILPVIGEANNRLHVRLAQRPDESTTWIDKSNAVLTTTHWAVVIDIAQHWLYVFHWGEQVGSFPVGDGAPGTPTPTGTYFVAFHAPPNGPGYGSVMLETSAHSRVIEHFEGGNDAIIAIHGSIFSDSEIGDHGAAISNGCIRMHEWDLRQVAHVVDGSPVFLVD